MLQRTTSVASIVIPKVMPIESAAGTTPPRIIYYLTLSAAPLFETAIEYDAFVAD